MCLLFPGNRILWDTGLLNGAPNKLELLAHFYVGETVTAIQKVALVPGGQEVSTHLMMRQEK